MWRQRPQHVNGRPSARSRVKRYTYSPRAQRFAFFRLRTPFQVYCLPRCNYRDTYARHVYSFTYAFPVHASLREPPLISDRAYAVARVHFVYNVSRTAFRARRFVNNISLCHVHRFARNILCATYNVSGSASRAQQITYTYNVSCATFHERQVVNIYDVLCRPLRAHVTCCASCAALRVPPLT